MQQVYGSVGITLVRVIGLGPHAARVFLEDGADRGCNFFAACAFSLAVEHPAPMLLEQPVAPEHNALYRLAQSVSALGSLQLPSTFQAQVPNSWFQNQLPRPTFQAHPIT